MNDEALAEIMQKLRDELTQCEYGEVTVTMLVHGKRIMQYTVVHSQTTKMVKVPGPDVDGRGGKW